MIFVDVKLRKTPPPTVDPTRQSVTIFRQSFFRNAVASYLRVKSAAMTHPLNNLVRAFLGYIAQRDNCSPEYLCRLSAIDFLALRAAPVAAPRAKSEVAISKHQLEKLWLNAISLTNDDLIGLHFGESLQLAALGLVGQIIQTSGTVGEALIHSAQRLELITDLFSMEVTGGGKTKIQIGFYPHAEYSERFPTTFTQLIDMIMVFVLHEVDGLLLQKIKPETVKMPLKNRSRPEEYHRLLRIGHITNSRDYRLTFPGEYQGLPLITANYELQSQLIEKIAIEELAVGEPLRRRVENYLKKNAYLGIPTLEQLAANFNTSTRSLQRQLRAEDTSYQELASDCRMSLAAYYLESGRHRVKEISQLLGYNEVSAFSRAFKRWAGRSPKAIGHQ
jgi:AraC-like DNA-binding protein